MLPYKIPSHVIDWAYSPIGRGKAGPVCHFPSIKTWINYFMDFHSIFLHQLDSYIPLFYDPVRPNNTICLWNKPQMHIHAIQEDFDLKFFESIIHGFVDKTSWNLSSIQVKDLKRLTTVVKSKNLKSEKLFKITNMNLLYSV